MGLRAICVCIVTGLMFASGVCVADDAEMFPFPVKTLDITHDATDMSWMNERPAGKHGFVQVRDGHFADGSGKRIRFLGVNLCNSGAFPDHRTAEKVAARLAKLGINCVRLHHMDGHYAPSGIWDPAYRDKQHLDAGQLDRLDYLIYQLKQHGIYTNINLHVSRQFAEADGFPHAGDLPKFDKGVDNYEPRMIELQKEYARALLTHRNPYTRTRYVDEPAVAFIEINNENSLLEYCMDGVIADLPEYYLSQLRARWNAWLRSRYSTTEKLREVWQTGSEPLGPNLLANSDFSSGTANWVLEAPSPARATMEAVDDGPRSGGKCLHARLTQVGKRSWDFQVHQIGLDLVDGKPYTLRFAARSDKPREINVGAYLDKDDWHSIGLAREVQLTPEWKSFEFTFYVTRPEKDHNRISLNCRSEIGEVWIADVELRQGGGGSLPENARIEAGTVDLPFRVYTERQRTDFVEFVAELERAYAQDMYKYVREALGSKSLVIDSQASFGGMAGMYRESLLDYTDMHGYWQHPSFPNRSWDPADWRITNTSMVKARESNTLEYIALHRIAGKPFTVSEYNHPAPGDYTAECVPMLAAFAAHQDWDGIFLFDYHSSGDWDRDKISNYFQIDSHPAKIVMLPAAAAVFRRADLAPASGSVVLDVPLSSLMSEVARSGGDVASFWKAKGVNRSETISSRTSVRFTRDGEAKVTRTSPGGRPGGITWRADGKVSEFLINSPATRGAVGFISGRTIDLGALRLRMNGAEGRFAAVIVVALDGKPLEESGHILVSAVGRVENQGMVWNEDRTSVGNKWGTGPTIAEGIPASLSLRTSARAARVYALDGGGGRMSPVPSRLAKDGLTVDIGPKWRTLWYEIEIER